MPVLGKTKHDVVAEFRTAEILEAARGVFADRGFHEAKVDEIAEAAGVAKGTVYLYYHSKKEDLLGCSLKHGIAALHEELEKRIDSAATVEEKVYTIIATKVRFFEKERDFFKIYFSEFGNAFAHPAQVHDEFRELYLRQAKLIEAVLQEGIKQKSVRNVRKGPAAVAIAEITRGIITQRLLGWSKGDVNEEIDFIFDLVWKGIGNQ